MKRTIMTGIAWCAISIATAADERTPPDYKEVFRLFRDEVWRVFSTATTTHSMSTNTEAEFRTVLSKYQDWHLDSVQTNEAVHLKAAIDAHYECTRNLHDLDAAKDHYRLDHPKTPPESVAVLIPKYLHQSEEPKCPLGGTYAVGTYTNHPACSYRGHTRN